MSDNKTKTQVKFVKVNESTAEFTSIVSPKDEGVLTSNGWNKTDGNKWQKDGVILTKLEYAKIVREGAIIHACDYNNPDIVNKYYGKDTLYVDGCQITDIYNTLKPLSNKDRPNTTDVGCIAGNEYTLDDLQKMTLGDIFDKIFFPKPKVSHYTVEWGNTHEYWITSSTQGVENDVTPVIPTLDLNRIVVTEHFETGKGFYIENENQSELIGNDVYTYDTADVDEMHNERTILSYTWDSANNRYNVYNISDLDKDFVFGSKYNIILQCYSDPDGGDSKEWRDVTPNNIDNILPIKENVVDVKLRVLVYKDGNLVYNSNSDDINDNDKGIYGDSNSCPLYVYKNVHDITLNATDPDLTYVERDAFVPNNYTYKVRFTDGTETFDIILTNNTNEITTGPTEGTLCVSIKGPSDKDYGDFLNSNYSGNPIMTSAWSKTSAIDRKTYGMHINNNAISVKATYRKTSENVWDDKYSTKDITIHPLSIDYVEMTKDSDKKTFTRHDNFDLDVYYSPYTNADEEITAKYYGPFGVTIHYKANNTPINNINDGVTRTNKTDVVYYGDGVGGNTGVGGTTRNDAVDGTSIGYTHPDTFGEANTSAAFTMFSDANYTNSMTITNIKSGINISGSTTNILNGITNTLVNKKLKTSGDIYFKFEASKIKDAKYTNNNPVLYFDEISESTTAQEIKEKNNKNNNYKFHYTVNEHKFDRISFNEYKKTDYLIADYCDILEKTTDANGNPGPLKVYGQLDGDNPAYAAGVALNVKQSSGASGTIADKVKDGTLGTNEIGYVLLTDSKKIDEYGVAKTGTTGNYRLNYVASNSVNASSIISAGTGQTGTTTGTNLNKFSSAGTDHARFWNTSSNWLLATSDNEYKVPETTSESEITYYFKNEQKCVGCEFNAVDTVFVGLIPKSANIVSVQIGDKIVLDSLVNYSKNNVKNAVRYNTSATNQNHYDTFNGNDSACGYFQKVSSTTDMCPKTEAGHTGITFGQVGRWAANASDDTAHYILSIVVPTTVQIDEDGSTAWTGSVAIVSDQFQILREQEMTGFDRNYKYNVYTPNKTYTGLYGCQQEFHLMKK